MYLDMNTRPFILLEIEQMKMKDNWMNVLLLEVYQHISVGQWSQGKNSWLKNMDRFKGKDQWDAFGTEDDFVVCCLDYIHYTETMSVCDAHKCPLLSQIPKRIKQHNGQLVKYIRFAVRSGWHNCFQH